MLSETAINILSDARHLADADTASEANDYDPNSTLVRYLNSSYRDLVDWIIRCGGQDLLLTYADIASPYTLPVDYYRSVAVSRMDGTDEVPLDRFNFRERLRHTDEQNPAWRVLGTARITFFPPTAAPTTVRLWYIPNATSLTAESTVAIFGGWDEYLSSRIALRILAAEERQNSAAEALFKSARDRVKSACATLNRGAAETIALTHVVPEDGIDFGDSLWVERLPRG